MSEPSIFEKILSGDIPGEIIFEDEWSFALRDINPQAPLHLLIIPKKRITRISEAEEDDKSLLGHLLIVAQSIAQSEKLEKGYRIVINNGEDGGESVPHLHVHLLGGRALTWPPG